MKNEKFPESRAVSGIDWGCNLIMYAMHISTFRYGYGGSSDKRKSIPTRNPKLYPVLVQEYLPQ